MTNTTAPINGLRSLTAAEEKAVGLRARGISDAVISRETALSPEQILAAVERHAAWQQLRSKTAATATAGGDSIAELLSWAEASGQTRSLTLAARIREQLAALREERKNFGKRAQAQAEVDRLTAELDAAKKRLKRVGTPGRAQAVGRPSGAVPRPDRTAYLADVRTWARDQGHTVSDLGRIPTYIQTAYDAAHGGTP